MLQRDGKSGQNPRNQEIIMVKNEVGNLIIKIKNAGMARKHTISVPYSKFTESILAVLASKDLIGNFTKKGKKVMKSIDVEIKYENERPVIAEVDLISKLSRRMYGGAKDIKSVKSGYGYLFVSTSKGVMTGEDAKAQKVGGELLFKVW